MIGLRILPIIFVLLSSRLEASHIDIENCIHSIRKAWSATRHEIVHDVRIPRQNLLSTSTSLTPSTVVLAPDYHGSFQTLDRALELLDRYSFDWIALEMLPPHYAHSNRTLIPLSPLDRARQHIQDHWNHFYRPRTDVEALQFQMHPPLFKLVWKAHKKNMQIVGIYSGLTIPAHTPHIDPELLAWSNRISAQHIPKEGRGLIFMGGLHFLAPFSSNLQDYLPTERDVVIDWPENP